MAKQIPRDVIDQITAETNIIDIISQYVDIEKRGKNYFGYCPFHEERTPSFSVNEEKQFFHCFSCGRGGTAYNFLMELEGYSFPEAVKQVAEMGHASVTFDWDSINREENTFYTEREQTLVAIHEELATFYHYLLMNTKVGQDALHYLYERGLTQETLETYKIGLSPDDGSLPIKHLQNKGFAEEVIQASGISVGEGERLSDRFRSRIMFPLRDIKGKTIAFSGRILPGGSLTNQAKYLNSPETEIFHKSAYLFNLDIAKESKRKTQELMLYEGFVDVIAAANAGLKNGVASMGTSLTDEHIQLILRHSKRLVLAYDGDEPGQKATKRAIEKVTAHHALSDLSVLAFPNQLDPDEFIQRYGATRYQSFVKEQRLTPLRFYRLFYRNQFRLNTDQGKIQYIEAMLPLIAELDTPIEQAIYLKDLSEDTNLTEEVLNRQFEQYQQQNEHSVNETRQSQKTADMAIIPSEQETHYSLLERSEMHLFSRLLYHEDVQLMLAQEAETFHFETPLIETLYILWQTYQETHQNTKVNQFLETLTGQEERQKLLEIMRIDLPDTIGETEIVDLVYIISVKSKLEKELKTINQQLEDAKLKDDISQINDLNLKKIDIFRKLKQK